MGWITTQALAQVIRHSPEIVTCAEQSPSPIELAPATPSLTGCADLLEAFIAGQQATRRAILLMLPVHPSNNTASAAGANQKKSMSAGDLEDNFEVGHLIWKCIDAIRPR